MGRLWDVDLLLCRAEDDGRPSVLSRVRAAIELIERSAAFEGDGDLGAAHLVLSGVARDLAPREHHEEQELTLSGLELLSGAF